MTCRELVDFLMDYLDGELAPDIRRRFDAHLDQCPDCVTYLDTYRETLRLTRELGAADAVAAPEVPEALVRAVLAARDRERRD
jgi:anti-sigma factor RsiW